MGFISTDCITAPSRQMLFATRTVFVAQDLVCSAFEVLLSVAFHLRVLPISAGAHPATELAAWSGHRADHRVRQAQ